MAHCPSAPQTRLGGWGGGGRVAGHVAVRRRVGDLRAERCEREKTGEGKESVKINKKGGKQKGRGN